MRENALNASGTYHCIQLGRIPGAPGAVVIEKHSTGYRVDFVNTAYSCGGGSGNGPWTWPFNCGSPVVKPLVCVLMDLNFNPTVVCY
ncbi:MAG: hypothetical protein H6581_00875 [Bacteroidia bacterium]|nr:hypothetical protein [Bacteroidia bacterium]